MWAPLGGSEPPLRGKLVAGQEEEEGGQEEQEEQEEEEGEGGRIGR